VVLKGQFSGFQNPNSQVFKTKFLRFFSIVKTILETDGKSAWTMEKVRGGLACKFNSSLSKIFVRNKNEKLLKLWIID